MARNLLMIFFLLLPAWASVQDNHPTDKLEHDLHQLINSTMSRRASRDSITPTQLFQAYTDFVDKLNNEFASVGRQHLSVIDTLWLWNLIQADIMILDQIYAKLVQVLHIEMKAIKPTSVSEWLDFADIILNHPNVSVPSALNRIFKHIIEQKLFTVAHEEASAQLCNSQQSPQQLLYNLYKIIQMTEVKGYMMMHFSYELLTLYTNESFAKERSKIYNEHTHRVVETLRTVQTAMTYASKTLWKCDPAWHEEGKTYTELKQLFQGYIVNEVDLNPTATCRKNCGYYSLSKVHSCYDNLYCSQQRKCKGKVLNCEYIDSDMWICPSSQENRRYHSIKYENGMVFGDEKTCRRPTTKVDSWWRWIFWHCSYCMCTCDDHNSSSDRYFSLRNVTSDVMNNKVITGMRWKKVNQIIHLQIKEGKLLENGQIDPDSNSWQPIDNFTILNRDIRVGRDYHALSWEQKAIDLDDLTLIDGGIVTGVRFRMVGSHLNFEIRGTPFNYTTGKLIKPMEKSIWTGNDNTDNDPNTDKRRRELVINEPDIPTKSKAQSSPDSETNQFLNFAPTDLRKDVAQTTIPFLDIQPVETNPPSPLSGAGVFHKGRSGYGGFLALKILTFDFTDHIKTDYKPTPLLDTTEGTTVNEIPTVE